MRHMLVALLGLAACGRFGFDASKGAASDGQQGSDSDSGPLPDSNNGVPAAACPAKPMTQGTLVSTPQQLVAAVTSAVDGDTILIADGHYLLPSSMTISAVNVTIRSASNNAAAVVLDAQGAFTPVFYVRRRGVSFIALTIRRSADEAVFIEPDATGDVTGSLIYDVTFADNLGPGLRAKSYMDTASGPFSDNGEVGCSRFVQTAAMTCGTDGVFGIRLMATRSWNVHDNYFSGQCAPARIRALWADEGSRDINIVGNVFMNNMNNVITGGTARRTYPDVLPAGCTGTPQNWGGVICNNRIVGLNVAAHTGPDFEEGIALWSTCDTWVVHNTIVSIPGAETFENIEYRYSDAYVHLLNNLLEVAPLARDSGTIDPGSQSVLYSSTSDFVDASAGDLHLSGTATPGVGAPLSVANVVAACGKDADGKPRVLSGPTPGAYER